MLKLIFVGFVGALSTCVGASLALSGWLSGPGGGDERAKLPKFESVATELTAVPVITQGKVTAYLVLRISSTVDLSKIENPGVVLSPYLSDAAFRAAFEYAASGVQEVKAKDVELLTQQIKKNAEERLGKDSIGTVQLEQFNLVSASEIRDKTIKSQ